jgi:(1->4)-alpha-D-glucan 1-alpha-D-glucosylmutase
MLREQEMSVLLDIVPNHASLHPTNPTLIDVLESGRSSIYASFYDINWGSHRFGLEGKMLLPVLGTHLSTAVAKKEVKLAWNEAMRTVAFTYYSWVIPADPVTVARFLLRPVSLPLPQALLDPLRHLAAIPTHAESCVTKRRSLLPLHKLKLYECVRDNAEARTALIERLSLTVTDMLSLLNEQPYRLAFWRSASSEINYRCAQDLLTVAHSRAHLQAIL